MGKGKHLNSKKLIEQALENVESDRALASTLLIELMKILKTDETKHQYSGPVAAKYLETLQRSNEQMVKVATLIQKEQKQSEGLTEADMENIFSMISGGDKNA